MKDILTDLKIVHALAAVDITDHTDEGVNYVDLAGYEGAIAMVNFGAVTNVDASNKVIPVLQHCDSAPATNASWAAVDAADIVGSTFAAVLSATTDDLTQVAGYIGSKRYLRVVLDFTSAGTNPDHCPVSVNYILGCARHGAANASTPTTGTSTA